MNMHPTTREGNSHNATRSPAWWLPSTLCTPSEEQSPKLAEAVCDKKHRVGHLQSSLEQLESKDHGFCTSQEFHQAESS